MNTRPKLILAAVDFSTSSRTALEHAARLALHHGAKLHVLHIIDSLALTMLAARRGEAFESAVSRAQEGTHNAMNEWLSHSNLPAGYEVTLVVGAPLHEILEHVKSLQADLLVAGVAGASEHAEGAGSVAAKLARKCVVDVLLVRSGQAQAFGKIIAALDLSDHSADVAAAAYAMAAAEGAEVAVDLLRVWSDPGSMLPVMGPFGESGLSLDQAALPPSEVLMQKVTAGLQVHAVNAPAGIGVNVVVVESRKAGEGIAEQGRRSGAGLVVIGALGRTNLRYLLLGSTAERLLARVSCSVLVVKPAAE